MSYLLSLTSKLTKNKAPAPAPAPAVQIPIVESFLSVSESVVSVPQSISLVEETVPLVIEAVMEEVTEAPSEEQCASPLVPASTVSSHTEESC